MLDLKEVTLSDREWVSDLMRRSGFRGSEYTFANLFNWKGSYHFRIGRLNDRLILRSGKANWHYLFPAGEGDLAPVLEAMALDAREAGYPFVLYGVNAETKELLETLYPNRFSFEAVRDNFDYVYTREKLATLSGKKLHGKRNHIARFKDNFPDWTYERLTPENLHEAKTMSVEWCAANGCSESHSLEKEACAVCSGLEYFEELGLVGGLIRAEGRVVAFTFGSPVTEDTFVVHVEKAFADLQGCYPMINQQFVQNELSAYTYINREDDVGDEGLRKAKESYRPDWMYERYIATEKE